MKKYWLRAFIFHHRTGTGDSFCELPCFLLFPFRHWQLTRPKSMAIHPPVGNRDEATIALPLQELCQATGGCGSRRGDRLEPFSPNIRIIVSEKDAPIVSIPEKSLARSLSIRTRTRRKREHHQRERSGTSTNSRRVCWSEILFFLEVIDQCWSGQLKF